MAPNHGKPQSYVMQQQQALLQPVMNKEPNLQVKKECILFSQSVMNGWTPASATPTQMSHSSADGPEPRILSKKRRDLINAEIRELQNLLPLKKSSRERLSYLGILALTNTFIRKATFFKKECIGSGSNPSAGLVSDFANSLSGFLLVFNREGKILFSSDNILDYLGHTVVELASQGDSIFDIIDKEDHDMIRSQLEMQPQTENGEARRLSFFCRMSTSRYMKTQMRSWKNKIVHVAGKYHKPEMSNDWSDTAFFAVCEPIESKPVTDVRHHPTPRPTEFKAIHSPDMKFLEVPNNVATLLGYEPEELINSSWYQWIFPEDLNQARQQHMKFVKEDGSAFACVIRMIHKNGDLIWVDITAEKSQETISNSFVCNYIVIEEDEVPYYRLHHNLLPFPDHYSDVKRHYLASNSSLLATALSTDVGLASPSSLTSPSGRHPQSPGAGMSHMIMTSQGLFPDNMDTKSLLRRQLKRKLGVSMDSSLTPAGLSPGSYATGMEIFNLPPPNKMMMRRHTASDLLYPASGPGMYHAGIHHPYHEGIPHPMYMPPPPLLNDTSVLMHPEHHYRGEYTTIAQRPVDLPIHSETYTSSSPRTLESPMVRQSNQNNNVGMYQGTSEFKQSPPPLTNGGFPTHNSPVHSPNYVDNMSEPPRLNHAHSPPLQIVKSSPMNSPQHCDVISQEDNFYCDVNNIIDCSGTQMSSANSYAVASPASSHGNYSPAHSSYGSTPTDCRTSSAGMPVDQDLRNLITSYENQFDNVGQMKSMMQRSHYQYPQQQQMKAPMYPRRTHQMGSRSPLQEINTSCAMESKPYQLQYSISSHPPSRSGFGARRIANGERGVDWMKKYSHMTPMEMLLSDSESNSSYYG